MDRVPSLETTERLLAHTAWLERVARALTTTRDDADEVVQETWRAALERPPSHLANLRGWLGTLARNLVRMRARSRDREAARLRELPGEGFAPAADHAVARAELQKRILAAVLALDEPYRTTLVHRFLDERTAEEIALERREPIETVRTRIKRGLAQVRAKLAADMRLDDEQLCAWIGTLFPGGLVAMSKGVKVGIMLGAASLLLTGAIALAPLRRPEPTPTNNVAPTPAAAATASTVEPTRIEAVETPSDASPAAGSKPVTTTFDLVGRVVDAAGAPVANAMVVLFDAPDRIVAIRGRFIIDCLEHSSDARRLVDRLERGSGAIRSALTDENGSFALAGVPRFRRFVASAFEQRRGFTDIVEVSAPADDQAARIELTLGRGIVVQGRVVDSDGSVAPGSQIQLSISIDGGTFVTTGSATSAAPGGAGVFAGPDGSFALPSIPAEAIGLMAIDVTATHRSEVVELRIGDSVATRDVTLRLSSDPFVAVLRGRVLGPDGEAFDSTHPFWQRIAAWEGVNDPKHGFHVFPICGPVPRTGETSPDLMSDPPQIWVGSGSFDRKRGTYSCRAPLDEEFAPTSIAVIARNRVLAVAPLDANELRECEGEYEGPELRIDESSLPSGKVDDSHVYLAVRLVDFDSKQILEAPASIRFVTRSEAGGTSAMTDSWQVGQRREVLPGRTAVVVTRPGYVSAWTSGDFTPRPRHYEVTVTLRRAVRVIRGTIVDSDGRPVAGARVHWIDEVAPMPRASALDPATTDPDGRFEIASVGEAAGRLAVEADGFAPAMVDVGAGTVDVSPTIELARGVAVTLECSMTADGTTPMGELIILRPDGAVVRADWTVHFESARDDLPRRIWLAPGEYLYRIEFLSRARDEGEFIASDGAHVRVIPRTP